MHTLCVHNDSSYQYVETVAVAAEQSMIRAVKQANEKSPGNEVHIIFYRDTVHT